MEVILVFLAFAFVAGARAKDDVRSPRAMVLLLVSVVVTIALLSHRVA